MCVSYDTWPTLLLYLSPARQTGPSGNGELTSTTEADLAPSLRLFISSSLGSVSKALFHLVPDCCVLLGDSDTETQ